MGEAVTPTQVVNAVRDALRSVPGQWALLALIALCLLVLVGYLAYCAYDSETAARLGLWQERRRRRRSRRQPYEQ